MDKSTASELIAILRNVSKSVILPHFRKLPEGGIETKTNASDLVTIADKEAEKRITEAVLKIFPEAHIVGEEAVAERPEALDLIADAELSVIIDPIDGTWNYAHGVPLFGTILAVAAKDEIIFGALFDPMGDNCIYAIKGQGAHFLDASGDGYRLSLPKTNKPISDMFGILPYYFYEGEMREKMFSAMTKFDRVTSFRCSCHEYRMFAEGALDFSVSGQLKPWDHAAGALIAEEAGGYVRMLSGEIYRPSLRDGILLASTGEGGFHSVRELLGF